MLFNYWCLCGWLFRMSSWIGCWSGYFSDASENIVKLGCQRGACKSSEYLLYTFMERNDSSSGIFSTITQYCVCSLTRIWHDFHHYFHQKAITQHGLETNKYSHWRLYWVSDKTKVIIISDTIEYQLLSHNDPFYVGFIIWDERRRLSRLGFYVSNSKVNHHPDTSGPWSLLVFATSYCEIDANYGRSPDHNPQSFLLLISQGHSWCFLK